MPCREGWSALLGDASLGRLWENSETAQILWG